MKYNLINQDAFEAMSQMPDESFDACLCDPPYGIGFMGKGWDHGVPSEVVWAELLRVLKPGAFLIAFGGTRTYHRLTCAVEDAGFEIRDCLMWVYGTGFPKSHNISKAIDKAAGAERKVVGRKTGRGATPVSDMRGGKMHAGGTIAGAFDASAITAPATPLAKQFDGYGTALKPAWEPCILAMKPLDRTFVHSAATRGVAGLNIDDCRVATGEQALGRWPANVIHDGSEEVTGLFPASRAGSASRFFYCAKASKAEKNAGCKTKAQGNPHPTVKPLALCKYLATLILPPDARARKIIVPFSGSGSEMLGAAEAGWEDVTGIESDTESGYIAVAEARLKHYQESLNDESTT